MGGAISRLNTASSNEISQNLGYLTENLTNLYQILILLIQHGIISQDEFQLINSERTDLRKNNHLLSLIQKKNWPEQKTIFLQILRNTGNEHCADRIEETVVNNLIQSTDLSSKWWPEEKTLPKAFLERKTEECLLTDTLKNILSGNTSEGMAVITQQVAVSGLGGIGKTTTAIWFAQNYQADYDRILWIDCGEKSLLQSFKKLARFLQIRESHDLDLKELAASSFQILKNLKCLLIFDNAECYIGNEGIKDVLPKCIKNFDVLITSRHKQWGDATGDGEIPLFQMDVFNQNESVEFMRKHIKFLPENVDSQLHLLCDLLGNLPLAIQIAIATLNRQNVVNLETYIDKIQNSPEILHGKFDNYEKTIDKTMKISLHLIQQHESNDERKIGKIALRILSIFGFIIPDNVETKFFMSVETKRLTLLEKVKSNLFNVKYQTAIFSKAEIDAAMNVLEIYSLITRNVTSEDNYTLSIHRLLQQVIRHNFKSSTDQILTQILNCDGFLEYKLIPFSYADERLQKKFPKIKAELIDKLQLSQLLRERRFKEAVELSRIMKNSLHNPVSQYNFAVCLKHNNELTECLNVLESLLDQIKVHKRTRDRTEHSTKLEIIETNTQLDKCFVIEKLFSIYFSEKNVTRARKSVLKWKQVTLPMLPLNDLINFLNLMSLPNLFLERDEKKNCITLRVKQSNELAMQLELRFWVLDENLQFHEDLQELVLVRCKILASKNPFLTAKNITLRHVNIGYKCTEDNKPISTPVFVTDIFNFSKVKKLMFMHMQIEFRSNAIPQEKYSRTRRAEIFNWGKNTWTMTNLFVYQIDLTLPNPLTILNITLKHCTVDIPIFPPALKKLTLFECILINCFKSNSVEAKSQPNSLEELSLINISVKDMKHGEQCTPFAISHFIPPMLTKLTVTNIACKCVSMSISLSRLKSIQALYLAQCALVFDRNISIAPTELTLKNVLMVDKHQRILTNVIVNQFVNFNAMKFLCFTGMSIDFSEAVSMKQVILKNANTMNWESGRWIANEFHIFTASGPTDMNIDQQVIMEDEDNAKNLTIQTRKEELLKYFKRISGYKTISGLYDSSCGDTANEELITFQRQFNKRPGILTTRMPDDSADAFEWQSFIDQTISNWNNGHLVHIRWQYARSLYSISYYLKKGNAWNEVLDTLASYLQQLHTAGVVAICDLLPQIYKALWRDYSPNYIIKLYQMTRDYLTQHYGLSSLIWVWSIDADEDMTELKNYWPGDNYVDVVSVYSSKPLTDTDYQKVLETVGDKPISIEWTRYTPTPQLLVAQSRWTWFTVTHYPRLDTFVYIFSLTRTNTEHEIKTILNSRSVINWGSHEMFKP